MAVFDNFDSYSVADLNGQGSWTAAGEVDVQNSVSQSASNSITRTGAGGLAMSTKSITAITNDGATVSFYVRSTVTNDGGGGSFGGAILSSVSEIARVVMSQDNNDIRLIGATTVSLLSGATTNTWYKCTIEIDFTNDRVRAKIDSGAYSSYVSGLSGAFSQVDVIGMVWGGTSGSVYIDTFEYTTVQNITLTAGIGAFTLTGTTTGLGRLYTLVAGVGSFVLTGIDTALRFAGWSNQTKNTSSWNNQDKVSTVIDSYGKSNTNATYSLYNGYSVIFMGQSFSNTNVGYLDNIKFHIFKSGSPAGNATAYLYAHTGTLGSSSLAIGSPLATSSTLIDVSTLGTTTAQELSTFYFTGYGRVRMEASTNYCIVLGYNGGDASNYLKIGTDTTSPTPVGNIMYSANGTSWTAITANDLIYSVSSFQSPTFSNVTKNSSTFTNQLKN